MSTEVQQTHYHTLGIAGNASRREIQASFRRLVKIYHPDKNPQRTDWAAGKMRELIQAYKVLTDELQRNAYDRKIRVGHSTVPLSERLAQRPNDPRAQSQLILHNLLKGDFDSAVEAYERMAFRRTGFSLADHLDERDYLDSLFLLGEAYERRRQWRTAARFYWEAYESERNGPHKRYFFDELKDRLRILFSQRLVQGLSPEDMLKNYRRAVALGIGNREAALIYKKIAAIESGLGNEDRAGEALDHAQRLCPGMKTIDKLRKKIAGA